MFRIILSDESHAQPFIGIFETREECEAWEVEKRKEFSLDCYSSGIVDLSTDVEYNKQKDIEEANCNLFSGKTIIGLIGGLNLRKQREGTFNVSMAEYLTHFSVPFNLLSAGAIDNSLAFLHGLSSMGPYSAEEIEQIKAFHIEAISNRPKR